MRLPLAACLLLVPSLSCGSANDPVSNAAGSAGASPASASRAAPLVRARVHAHSPALDALREALDRGDKTRAEGLLAAADESREEALLLRARFHALDAAGTLEALRLVEAARKSTPKNPDVYATAAEIYASRSSFDTGWQEIERGVGACGEAAELSRARGVLWISRERGARQGLEHLERARAIDPDLPFVDRALSQAHLLVGKEEAAQDHRGAALEHARAALKFDPTDVDARRFLADAYALNLDFTAAIALVEGLAQEGRPLEGELAVLHKKAGLTALLERDRPRAIDHFIAARNHGLSPEELASAAQVLRDECAHQTRVGLDALSTRDLTVAETALRRALACSPADLAAKNHLAVTLYQRGQFGEAASLWRGVLAQAQAEGIELPDPVHVNLALALSAGGDRAQGLAVLDEYLARVPEGTWREQTESARRSLETAR